MIRTLAVVLSALLLVRCQTKLNSIEELREYVNNESNGLTKSVESNGLKLSVSYLPTDYWVANAISETTVNDHAVDSLRRKYSSRFYFLVSISRNGKEALVGHASERYTELVQTMSFRMADYVSLTTEQKESIPVGDFALNRTFGLGASTDLLFAFEDPRLMHQDHLNFDIKEFGLGTENQRFEFSLDEIRRAPLIVF